ncbi:APC family permease, partial [Geobacillus sp. MMMUD3]|nr:APC family permease [Geobacillus sp. MMMUD3]
YGMAKQNVLPPVFAKVLRNRRSPWVSIIFTTLIAFALIIAVTTILPESVTASLGGTTSLLLLAVFAVVNVAVLILRRQTVDHKHFRTPTVLPWIGVFTCAFLVGPWARLDDLIQYQIAIALIGIGVVLWAVTWLWNRSVRGSSTRFRHPEELS